MVETGDFPDFQSFVWSLEPEYMVKNDFYFNLEETSLPTTVPIPFSFFCLIITCRTIRSYILSLISFYVGVVFLGF